MRGDEKFDLSFKILTVGESGVGKTSLLLQYVESTFSDSLLSTVGIDFKCKYVELLIYILLIYILLIYILLIVDLCSF